MDLTATRRDLLKGVAAGASFLQSFSIVHDVL